MTETFTCGHPRTEENSYWRPDRPNPSCRTCRNQPLEAPCPRCGIISTKALCNDCRDIAVDLNETHVWGVRNRAPKVIAGGKRMCRKGLHELRTEEDVYRPPANPHINECRRCKRDTNKRHYQRLRAAA